MLHEVDKFSWGETFLSACTHFTPPSCEEFLKCKVTPAPSPSVLMSLQRACKTSPGYCQHIPCFAGLLLLQFSQAVVLHEVDNLLQFLAVHAHISSYQSLNTLVEFLKECKMAPVPHADDELAVSLRDIIWISSADPMLCRLVFSLQLEIHKRYGSVMWCDVQPDAQEKFLRIKNAYQTLVDSKSRSKYDASSRSRSGDWDPFNWDPSPGSARKSSQQQEEFYGFSKILTLSNNLIPCEW